MPWLAGVTLFDFFRVAVWDATGGDLQWANELVGTNGRAHANDVTVLPDGSVAASGAVNDENGQASSPPTGSRSCALPTG